MPYDSGMGRNFYGAINGGNTGGALARGMFAGAQGVPTDNPMPQYHGVMGFLDRMTNPTNPLGNIGMAMLIGGGGPAGQAGEMLMANHRQKLLDAQATAMSHAPADPIQVNGHLIQAQGDGSYKELFNGEKPDEAHQLLGLAGLDGNTPQGQAALHTYAMGKLDPVHEQSAVVGGNSISNFYRNSDIYGGGPNSPPTQPSQSITGPQDGPQPPASVGLVPPSSAQPAPGALAPKSNSFRDPAYGNMEAGLEQQYGLPPGLMSQIRTHGEMSNANQVSSAGAQSVYQITPPTRQLFMNKYGVDAYSSPQAAAQVAALHLRDSMARGEDPVRGYIGGTNKAAWGQQTQAYASRVYGAQGQATAQSSATPDRATALQQAQQAIASGADPAMVQSRLAAAGFSQ